MNKTQSGLSEVWGCLVFYRVPGPKRSKLRSKANKSIFVGYAENSKAYRLLDLNSNTIVKSSDVEFIKNKFYNDNTVESNYMLVPVLNLSIPPNNKRNAVDNPTEIRRSQRVRR